ncbi:hypothetical protein GQ600_14389 [Phytophthora cactorum]|nr:hypothetical protein GQ600_14389 [Phytophthora cactorum]
MLQARVSWGLVVRGVDDCNGSGGLFLVFSLSVRGLLGSDSDMMILACSHRRHKADVPTWSPSSQTLSNEWCKYRSFARILPSIVKRCTAEAAERSTISDYEISRSLCSLRCPLDVLAHICVKIDISNPYLSSSHSYHGLYCGLQTTSAQTADHLINETGALMYSDSNCQTGITRVVWCGEHSEVNGLVMPYVSVPPAQFVRTAPILATIS